MLFVDPTIRDGGCQMRLVSSCNQGGFNYGFSMMTEFDPCDDPTAQTINYSDLLPLDPEARAAYLECNVMPGSPLTLTPVCVEPDPMPDDAKCAPITWLVSSSYGVFEFDDANPTDPATGIDYVVTRLDDGPNGEIQYSLLVSLNDEAETEITVSFSFSAVDCCEVAKATIVLGEGAASIRPICPTDCDATAFDVAVTAGGSTSHYDVEKHYQWWQYKESEGTIYVDVVRLTEGRYCVIRNVVVLGAWVTHYAILTRVGDCCTGGAMTGNFLSSDGTWDDSTTVSLTPECS
jgi:hypothetical protein